MNKSPKALVNNDHADKSRRSSQLVHACQHLNSVRYASVRLSSGPNMMINAHDFWRVTYWLNKRKNIVAVHAESIEEARLKTQMQFEGSQVESVTRELVLF